MGRRQHWYIRQETNKDIANSKDCIEEATKDEQHAILRTKGRTKEDRIDHIVVVAIQMGMITRLLFSNIT